MTARSSAIARTISTPIILIADPAGDRASRQAHRAPDPSTAPSSRCSSASCWWSVLYIFVGNSGVISFGHIGFMCLGAYATAWFTIPPMMKQVTLQGLPDFMMQMQLPFVVSFVVSGLFAAVFALIVGRILMRLSGIAASIATFAMLAVINVVYSNWDSVTGGTGSIVGIPMLYRHLAGVSAAPSSSSSSPMSIDISRSGLALRAARDEAIGGGRFRRRHRARAAHRLRASAPS